jgi:exosortase
LLAFHRPTQRDAGLAVAIGALVALSPLSSPHLLLSLAIGGGASAAFLLFRALTSPASRPEEAATEADARAVSKAPTLARVPIAAIICLLLVGAIFAPTLQWLYTSWTGSIWINTHGLFIPPVMAYMIYEALRRDRGREAESSAWGFAFIIPGLIIAVLDSIIRTNYLAVIGLVVTLPGISLLLLGTRRTRLIAFPLFVGVFMIPVPGTYDMTIFLRHITAVGAEALLQIQGFSVLRTDTVLELPWGNVIVAKACSGLSTLYSAITVSSILVYYSQTPKRRYAILGLMIPLAIGANIVRALALVMLSYYFGTEILDTQAHEASGVATFAVVLVILYSISDMPRRVRRTA